MGDGGDDEDENLNVIKEIFSESDSASKILEDIGDSIFS